jgi:hypothetical protein
MSVDKTHFSLDARAPSAPLKEFFIWEFKRAREKARGRNFARPHFGAPCICNLPANKNSFERQSESTPSEARH